MTRRDLIKYLLATPIAATIDVEKLLWVPEKTIFIPDLICLKWEDEFYGGARGGGKTDRLHGLLYHNYSHEYSRQPYLGIDRSTYVKNKLDR